MTHSCFRFIRPTTEQAFLKKAKERQKVAFAKKGLEWNETNIRNEERMVSQAYDEAVKDCEAR